MSRQYVEMPRARVEGLLNSFPKLLSSDKPTSRQHTFIETESVRYVYQPLDQLYVFLITTKASNILEDLETLRLFARIVPEYCEKSEEKDVMEHVFELVFAFDEVVALGYRENINVSQVRTYVEMDSNDERVYYQIKKSQEEEAKKVARDKAKELARTRMEGSKRAASHMPAYSLGGFGPQIAKIEPGAVIEDDTNYKYRSSAKAQMKSKAPTGKAMKLGAKVKADIFDEIDNSQDVANGQLNDKRVDTVGANEERIEQVHVKLEETINLKQKRDGGLDQLDIHGALIMRISNEAFSTVSIRMFTGDKRNLQLQVHPNMDKKAFQTDRLLTLKNQSRPFPLNTDASILKWRFQTTDETYTPLSINCWPSETRDAFEVNMEYMLENDDFTLENVCIVIPLPQNPAAPAVSQCDGEYWFDRAHHCLEWRLPLIDSSNKQGSLEFKTAAGNVNSFFPVTVRFISKSLFCDIKVEEVVLPNEDVPIKFSQEAKLSAGTYEIV